jgi:hypothetical protein
MIRMCGMEDNATAIGSSPEVKDELVRFQAIWREEAGLAPIQLPEVRRKRCLDNYPLTSRELRPTG